MPRTIREWGSAARARAAAFFDYLSDSFRPILGVLLGASLVIAIVNVIVALGIVPDGETSTGWILLKAIWEGVFTVLPIMIAYNAAKKLDVDPWLGGAIMAALMTPQLTGVMSGMSGTSVSSALSGRFNARPPPHSAPKPAPCRRSAYRFNSTTTVATSSYHCSWPPCSPWSTAG